MSDFDGQRSLHRQLSQNRPQLQAGMTQLLERMRKVPHGSRWSGLRPINWNPVLERWVAWIDGLLAAHRPPSGCEVLWFETPSLGNAPVMGVAAYARLGPASDSYGTEDPCVWPSDQDLDSIKDWTFALPELDVMLNIAGWTVDEIESDQRGAGAALRGQSELYHACALLLALNGLPRTSIRSLVAHPSGLAVLLGFKSGGVMPIGQLRDGTWSPIRRAKPNPIVLTAISADERRVLAMYQPRRFVALGGDLNERHKDGTTALMDSAFSEPTEVRALLESGADASLRGPGGESILHRFGACKIETLRLLVKHGADPHALDGNCEPVTTRLVRDGRCTVRHLKFYESLGVRLPPQSRRMSYAMACVASGGVVHRGALQRRRGMLEWLTSIGHDINARDDQRRTPLWLALEEHVKHLESFRRRAEKESYGHHRVAELLIEFGADPKVVHPAGMAPFIPCGATPLMVRRYDDDRLVKALLRHGADPLARSSEGMTALDYAKQAAAEPRLYGNQGAAQCAVVLERAMRASRRDARKR